MKVKSSEVPGGTGSCTFQDIGEINDYLRNLTKMIKRIKELYKKNLILFLIRISCSKFIFKLRGVRT